MTRDQWEQLSDKAKWDIKVALRGPDSYYGEVLKWFTTSVIRGQMRDVFRVGGLVNPDLNLVVLPTEDSESIRRSFASVGRLAWNYRHFVEHVATAADWINVGKMRVESKVWHAAMQAPTGKQAIEHILAAAEKYNAGKADDQYDPYPAKLYKPEHLKELERHFKSTRIYA